jgi:hypothetical protein
MKGKKRGRTFKNDVFLSSPSYGEKFGDLRLVDRHQKKFVDLRFAD